MFTKIFKMPAICNKHIRQGPMAGYLEQCAQRLCAQGYSRGTVQRYLYAWEAFCHWLTKEQIDVAQVTGSVVERFVDERVRTRIWHGRAAVERNLRMTYRPALHHLTRNWIEDGYLSPSPASEIAPSWYALHLADYSAYLLEHRGLCRKTVTVRLRETQRFLDTLSATSWADVLPQIALGTIDKYLLACRQRFTGAGMSIPVSMFRSWLRYLFVVGELPGDWSQLVPTYRRWRLSDVPSSIPWQDVERMLGVIDRDTPTGKRDYAMMMFIVTYGLRADEVRRLCLDDISWRDKRFCIRRAKNKYSREYPLMSCVADALVTYLREGRPTSSCREMFLSAHAPHGPLHPGGATFHITRKYFLRAGLNPARWGPHTLRHSFAIHLLEEGCSLKTIGDLLGHRSAQATFIYTKAPCEMLREVGLDVTEVWK